MTNIEGGRGSPYQKLTIENTPKRADQNFYGRPREELVKDLQSYIKQRKQELIEHQFGEDITPAEVIRLRLEAEESESLNLVRNKPSLDQKEGNFFWQLRAAWDALAYDHYNPGSDTEMYTGIAMWSYYRRSHKPAIKLSHPSQVQAIDAMTEAVGIPHQKGQAEIEIPEKLRNYVGYQLSPEYQDRVAAAKMKRNK
jgi:hypothetical protein